MAHIPFASISPMLTYAVTKLMAYITNAYAQWAYARAVRSLRKQLKHAEATLDYLHDTLSHMDLWSPNESYLLEAITKQQAIVADLCDTLSELIA